MLIFMKGFRQLTAYRNLLFFLVSLLLLSCHTQQQVQGTHSINMRMKADSVQVLDQNIIQTIKPYKLAIDSLMNIEINTATTEMKKELPEGALGNMVCDVLMDYASAYSEVKPDFCLMNNGGLRIPTIYIGAVYVRTIYELMPFENQLLLLKVKGSNCKLLLDVIAQNGGAPVSGLRMKIEKDSASEVLIQNLNFDINKEYWILTSDYLANGGDKTDALKDALQVIDLNIKIRDALLVQIKQMKTNGKTLAGVKDGRIIKNQ